MVHALLAAICGRCAGGSSGSSGASGSGKDTILRPGPQDRPRPGSGSRCSSGADPLLAYEPQSSNAFTMIYELWVVARLDEPAARGARSKPSDEGGWLPDG
jgi:hypothetical protein